MSEMQDLKLKVRRIESCVLVLLAAFIAYVLSDLFGVRDSLVIRFVLSSTGASIIVIVLWFDTARRRLLRCGTQPEQIRR
jgi:hypothetical protein